MNNLNSIDAEQWVIGSILIEPDIILAVSDAILPNDFWNKQHQQIYSNCLELWMDGTLDVLHLSERLKEKKILAECGGIEYLIKLSTSIPTTANIKYHAGIVKKFSLLRGLYLLGNTITETVKSDSDVVKVISVIENKLIEVNQAITTEKSITAQEIIKDIYKDWETEKGHNNIETPDWLTTNYYDKPIPCLMAGHIWVIGGYTSTGKSTLLAQLVCDLCVQGNKVLMVSLEDSYKEKVIKLISNISNIYQKKLLIGDIKEIKEKIGKAVSLINTWGLWVLDSCFNIEDIRLKIKKFKMQNGIQVVCIDFIQNLLGEGSLYERMSGAVIHLQKIAKEFGITIIILSQVSNEAMRGDSEVIGLKGAGELASAADIVIWIKRHKGDDKQRWLDCEIKKNRPFGVTGVIPLQFSEHWTRIERRK